MRNGACGVKGDSVLKVQLVQLVILPGRSMVLMKKTQHAYLTLAVHLQGNSFAKR